MEGYSFTDRVRKVLDLAREEALSLGHEYIGTEHLLLGLLAEGQGLAATVLQNLGVELLQAADAVRRKLKPGKYQGAASDRSIPYTSRAKKVLECSMIEARELNHTYVGTEHLLIGLLREGMGIAVAELREFGITEQTARAETLRILGFGPAVGGKLEPPAGETPTHINLVLHYSNGAIVAKRCADAAEATRFLNGPYVQ